MYKMIYMKKTITMTLISATLMLFYAIIQKIIFHILFTRTSSAIDIGLLLTLDLVIDLRFSRYYNRSSS